MSAQDDFTLVNYGKMSAAQTAIGNCLGKLNTELDDLNRDLNRLLEPWEGSAEQAYLAAQAQWNQAAANLATLLAQLPKKIGDAAQITHDADSLAGRQF